MTMWINWIASVTSTSPCLIALMLPSGSVGKGLCLFVLSFFMQHHFRVQADDLLTTELLWNHIMSSVMCPSCQGCCHSCLQMESIDADNVHVVHSSNDYLYFHPYLVAVVGKGGSNKLQLWVQIARKSRIGLCHIQCIGSLYGYR